MLALVACVFSGLASAQTPDQPKRNLLFIGQAKGYQHEAISTAMVTFYNLGRTSGLWNTQLRTDCTGITKKPLPWEAKNLNAFDEIYQIKGFSWSNSRVLLRLDAGQLDLTRKGVKSAENGFPVVWARTYGRGRVLYNGLGHVPAVWERPDFQKMCLEMVQWSMGLIPGDATPRPKVEP